MSVIPTVIDQHAEEAAFLWHLRDQAVRAPNYSLVDIRRLDNRVEAHLDGLRVAGSEGWNIAWKAAQEKAEPGELFTVGVLAFESGERERTEHVLKLVVTKPALGRAVASALGWLPETIASARLASLMVNPLPTVRRIGLAGYAIRRLNPGSVLEKALNDTDLDLRSRALKMAGEMGYSVWLPLLKKHLAIGHLGCRFQAAWSGALLAGDAACVTELQSIALTESGYKQRAAEVAVRRLDVPAANRWLTMLASLPGSERLAVVGIGALGDPVNVPRLLDWMKQPPLARVAGEAFAFITGADFAALNLEGNAPDGFEPGPNEDALDENVSMDPDEGLPWPDLVKVTRWWASNQGKFSKGTRYLLGKPITVEWLQEVILKQRQHFRLGAAIELAIRQPKTGLPEMRSSR
ncbi:MAG: TIGR02270 family protein [Planctomycetes bacterium]|nr:TIGR02270 family protein [Planctomycetota bacterium]